MEFSCLFYTTIFLTFIKVLYDIWIYSTSYNLQDIIADAELQGMGESENLNDFNEVGIIQQLKHVR